MCDLCASRDKVSRVAQFLTGRRGSVNKTVCACNVILNYLYAEKRDDEKKAGSEANAHSLSAACCGATRGRREMGGKSDADEVWHEGVIRL